MKIIIKENDKAIIWYYDDTDTFEIWLKLYHKGGPRKGEVIEPKDEDFGVFAWSSFTERHAKQIFEEITTGKRTIRPMTESTTE